MPMHTHTHVHEVVARERFIGSGRGTAWLWLVRRHLLFDLHRHWLVRADQVAGGLRVRAAAAAVA